MKVLKKVWLFLSLITLLVAAATWITFPELIILNISLMSIGIIILGVVFWPNREEIYINVTSRFAKRLYNQLFNVGLVFCILAMLQYLVYKNSYYLDITKQKQNTLSDQTKEILKSFSGPIEFTYFGNRNQWDTKLPLLQLYKGLKSDISINAVDVEREPMKIKINGIKSTNTLMIEFGKASRKINVESELSITNALLSLLRNKEIKIYSTIGHGELDFTDQSREGISYLGRKIINQTYQLDTVDLVKQGIPSDAYALMILGPQKAFLDKEIKLISNYIDKGGKLLVSLSPNFKNNVHKKLTSLISNYGLVFKDDIVVSGLSREYNSDATIIYVNNYDNNHPITKNFKGRTIFPISSSVATKEVEGYETSLIAFSEMRTSWGETNKKEVISGQVTYSKEDNAGPVALLGVSKNAQNRIALFGNSTFIINGYKDNSLSLNLFLNTLSWLVDDDPITSFNRPKLRNETIHMSTQQFHLIFYVSVLLFPILFFGYAIFLYSKRKSL